MENKKYEETTLSKSIKRAVDNIREEFSAMGSDFALVGLADESKYEDDAVHSPNHYKIPGTGIEVIDVIQGILSPEQFRGYCYGNVIKYILRAPNKGGAEDIEKASVYLGWLVPELKDEDCSSIDYKKGFEDGYDEACMDLLEDGDLVRREDIEKDFLKYTRDVDRDILHDTVMQIPAATKWKE